MMINILLIVKSCHILKQDFKVNYFFLLFNYTIICKKGKSFAFVTFTDEVCVDRCMAKRHQFNDEYGITMKRLLPDSITKCERLMSTPDIVIRMIYPGR